KDEDHLGFVIKADDNYIYYSGDTDVIPEEVIYGPRIDLAIIPVSGSYVMSKEEAVEEINKLKPELAVPMHYGRLVGSHEDAEYFARKAGVEVSIMTETKKIILSS
ncbi:MAG: MBL fold metallo-hydrolase, partial [Candidatus Omnitrophota bacterium]